MSLETEVVQPRRTLPSAAGLRILVALDDSPSPQPALFFARALAEATHGQLRLIRATGTEPTTGFIADSLADEAERLREAGVPAEWGVVAGAAVPGILAEARAWRPDLIAMATTKWSTLDRWLNGSVADAVVRSVDVPVLVVPPDWAAGPARQRPRRVLVPLDGSLLAERALGLAMRLADLLAGDLVLLRVVDELKLPGHVAEDDDPVRARAADAYVRQIAARVESTLPGRAVATRVASGSPAAEIARAARELDVDAIAMSTHGRSGLERAVLGSVTTATLARSTVPLLLLGPGYLAGRATRQVTLGASVRARDGRSVGEVHRVVVDFDQRAATGIVVSCLAGPTPAVLVRDILVPLEFVDRVVEEGIALSLTSEEFECLPDFAYNEFLAPPPTWTSFALTPDGPTDVPVVERKRLAPAQRDVTPSTMVVAEDGEIGRVDRVELDPASANVAAFWVRADGSFAHDLRIPVELILRTDDTGNLRVAGARADIEAYLGCETLARLV